MSVATARRTRTRLSVFPALVLAALMLVVTLLAPDASAAARLDGVPVVLTPGTTQVITVNRTRSWHARVTLWQRGGTGWKVVARPLRPAEPSAEWTSLSLSPDGSTLLAEWAYPCDSAAVVFVAAAGGRVRVATGERDWRKAPSARALGWTPAGKARVKTYSRWRGRPPGIYVIDPAAPAPAGKPSVQSGC